MEKAQEIIKHIFELYDNNEPTNEDIEIWCGKNYERYLAWKEAFENYDTVDVLKAIDEYWRYSSNKTKPTVAKLLTMLNTNKAEKQSRSEVDKGRYFSIEEELYHRDIEFKRNTNCFFPLYRRAVEYILERLLPSVIGMDEFKRLESDDYALSRGRKYRLALENGLFDKFDDILQQVARGEI